ncbi:mitochondrial carrier domain-containing protein [Gloeopeniophorella convolvens]|nr:mitochondrial carrier domain-containing protein [Gloeopeniophorella convolvens]
MSDSQDNKNEVKLDPRVDFLAGTAAGVAGLIVGFPFDTVKFRFQNPTPGVRYRSTFHALATIARAERLRGLYKGISSPLLTAPVLNGMVFATYRLFMKLQVRHDAPGTEPTLAQIFLAGAGCGLVSTLLTTPIELIKIQQQKQQQRAAPGARPPTARAVAAQVFRAGGVRALYRGLPATMLRDVGYGVYFAGYEGTLRLFAPARAPAADHDPLLDEVADTLARPWAALLAAPPGAPKARVWRTARDAYRAEGARVFWRGLAPALVRAVPVNMAVLARSRASYGRCRSRLRPAGAAGVAACA